LHTVIRGAVQIGGTLKDELKESMRKSASYNEPDGDVLGDKYPQTRSIIDPLRQKAADFHHGCIGQVQHP
jgi:hypothetical protein